jgi:hypothetical protein
MAMLMLQRRFEKEGWFLEAKSYWGSRFAPIKARLQDTFRYVELHTENRAVFSYEYASILRDCGSVFGSVIDVFVRYTKDGSRDTQYKFADYREFLRREVPDVHSDTLQIRRLFPNGLIIPFEDLDTETGIPKWWDAYNKIKHTEYDEFRMGNLENCITALAALALLGHQMGAWVNEPLFVNVCIPYHEGSTGKRLFPKT